MLLKYFLAVKIYNFFVDTILSIYPTIIFELRMP
jgi:hypothetical protein